MISKVFSCGLSARNRTLRAFSTVNLAAVRQHARHADRARVVVVGSGRMGQIRATLIRSNPRFELCGIVDPDHVGGESLGKIHGVPPFASLKDAIDSIVSKSRLDALIVSSPTFTHESVVMEAAANGISVFTEKPVDETADKIENLFDVADLAGIDLCCGFQRRFDPSYVAATEAVHSGHVGRPIMANIFFADHPSPPKKFLLQGGNIFMDLSAHDVDYISHTLQDEVTSVYATATSSDRDLEKAGIHDNATVVMNFSRGAVVTLFMSRAASYGYDQRCEVFGDRGLISVGNVHANSAVISTNTGVHQSRLQHSFPQRFQEAFALELNAFADTILLGNPWPVTAEQCVRVQRVADAARLSCESGGVIEVEPYFPQKIMTNDRSAL